MGSPSLRNRARISARVTLDSSENLEEQCEQPQRLLSWRSASPGALRHQSGRSAPHIELAMNAEAGSLPSPDTSNAQEASGPCILRRPDTKEIHVRVPIPNYQYLDQLAIRYGIRSLSGAVNFLIEFHRQSQASPNLGPTSIPAKQAE